MKVEQSQVTKLVITGVERHDSIHVYLEDYGDNKNGRVTISENGCSWSCFWGGMGMPLTEFLLWITNQYWIGYLDSNLDSEIDADNECNISFVKREIMRCRRKGIIDEYNARSMFDDVEYSEDIMHDILYPGLGDDYKELFDRDPYSVNWPKQENPEYCRMESRLNVIREALNRLKGEQ
ncbi:hypothetical protein I5F10_15750 [Proteus mirabilis]|nr:hypothetical protein [Proteus mirabilis]MBG6049626.1 hypothetical protein [Proteus mirabilis]